MELRIDSTVKLNNGVDMPRLGLGVFQIPQGPEAADAVRWALEAGYRHVDTAKIYGNEESVGQALKASGIARDQVFVTTKLWNSDQGYQSALDACDRSLERLGLDFVDLYLIHWPVQGLRLDSWRAMEKLLEQGKCRAIGVSNYMTHHLLELQERSMVVPAVNQIELNPFNYRSRLDTVRLCRERGIQVEAYSPLTRRRRLEDTRLSEIARGHGKSEAQVLIRWALQRDLVVIPKSSHRDRINENAAVFDFELTAEEMETLDGLDEDLTLGWDPRDTP